MVFDRNQIDQVLKDQNFDKIRIIVKNQDGMRFEAFLGTGEVIDRTLVVTITTDSKPMEDKYVIKENTTAGQTAQRYEQTDQDP